MVLESSPFSQLLRVLMVASIRGASLLGLLCFLEAHTLEVAKTSFPMQALSRKKSHVALVE